MRYAIENTISGLVIGVYEADSEEEALDKMAQNAGYRDYDDLNEQIEADPGDIEVYEVEGENVS